MTDVKEFLNDSHKQYTEVSLGVQTLNLANFDKVYELLPDLDTFEEQKSVFGRILLSGLKIVEPGFTYYAPEENRFIDNPSTYNPRITNWHNTDLDKALSNIKECQMIVNDLYGHYSVSLRIINFLLAREHEITKKNRILIRNMQVKHTNNIQI